MTPNDDIGLFQNQAGYQTKNGFSYYDVTIVHFFIWFTNSHTMNDSCIELHPIIKCFRGSNDVFLNYPHNFDIPAGQKIKVL